MIPKVFHFIWLNRGKHFDYIEYMSIRSKQLIYGNDYQYILWTDDVDMVIKNKNILISDGLQIRNIYEEVPYIESSQPAWSQWGCNQGTSFECDYYRFQLLYKLGGIYSDLDSIALHRIPEEWLTSDFYCNAELGRVNATIPTGIVIGFFLCKPKCNFIYRYQWLRRHLDVNYISNMQLGLLCTETEGTVVSTYEDFIPISWESDKLSQFLNSGISIRSIHSIELHLYGDAIQRVPNGVELAITKLKDYELYLNNLKD